MDLVFKEPTGNLQIQRNVPGHCIALGLGQRRCPEKQIFSRETKKHSICGHWARTQILNRGNDGDSLYFHFHMEEKQETSEIFRPVPGKRAKKDSLGTFTKRTIRTHYFPQ